MPRAALDYDPLIYVSCVAGMTGMYYNIQLFIGWNGSLENFLLGLVLNQ
jgi:hypothetical protein